MHAEDQTKVAANGDMEKGTVSESENGTERGEESAKNATNDSSEGRVTSSD